MSSTFIFRRIGFVIGPLLQYLNVKATIFTKSLIVHTRAYEPSKLHASTELGVYDLKDVVIFYKPVKPNRPKESHMVPPPGLQI